MRKIFNTLLIFGIVYFIFYKLSQNELAKMPDKADENTETTTPNTQQNPEIKPLGFWSNFAANTIAKIAESEQGKELLERIVRPLTNENNEQELHINNRIYLYSMLGIKSLKNSASNKIAYCGADVIASYQISNEQGLIVDKHNAELHLGDNKNVVLENVLVDMEEGETRDANIPYWYAQELKNHMTSQKEKSEGLKLKVTLHQLKSPPITNVRIFDDIIAMQPTFLCGNEIKTNVKITKFNGEIIFNGPIQYKLGSNAYPLIFSYILFNKLPQAARTSLVPASYLKNLQHKGQQISSKFPKASDELLLIEFNQYLN
jgi:hypothetical protein